MARALILAFVLVCADLAFAQEFHVEAWTTTVVRQEPDLSSPEIGRLTRGDRLDAFAADATHAVTDAENGFHLVALPTGGRGWIPRSRTHLHFGAAPSPTDAAERSRDAGITPADPLPIAEGFDLGEPIAYYVLERDKYTVGYDPRLKVPVWVMWSLTPGDLIQNVPRKDEFDEDDDVHEDGQSTLADYDAAEEDEGFDIYRRGHMAPADDFRLNKTDQRMTFLLTNMAPQIHAGHNNGVWKTIEGRMHGWVELREHITVIAGPVFESGEALVPIPTDPDDRADLSAEHNHSIYVQPRTPRQVAYNVLGDNGIAVPSAFYKIVIDTSDPTSPEVLAFLIPHERFSSPDLNEFIVSVDRIEELTGIDFLAGLDDTTEDLIESTPADSIWPHKPEGE